MGKTKICFIALTSIIMFYNLTRAQEMPQVPEQMKKLYQLEGTWEGEASMTMGNDVSKGTARYVVSKIAEGWGLYFDEMIDVPAMGQKYIGHNILGYHTGEGMYHLYTVDNFADVHDHKGKMTDDKTMNLEYIGLTPDGKTYVEKLTMNIVSSNEIKLKGESIIEGVSSYTFNISAKRK